MAFDIELNDIDPGSSSIQKPLYNGQHNGLEYQDSENLEDDDEEALLGSHPSQGPEQLPRKLWPQIRGIVIEVNHNYPTTIPGGNNYCQTAPTLLLTTVSLLFTGELLDHVSVSTCNFYLPPFTDLHLF
jgi:solute carrier family 41